MIDRSKLLDHAAHELFSKNGTLKASQLAGINAVIDEFEHRNMSDTRDLAYMLATAYWETGMQMQPVREAYYLGEPAAENYRKRLPYYPYYGRGLPQLTWESNYLKMGQQLNLDDAFVKDPDLALDPKYAISIMFEGMTRGLYTGVALDDYFNVSKTDFLNARRIVNGTDHAEEIEQIARSFWAGLDGPTFQRALRKGDKGDDVKLLQTALNVHGYPVGTADGDFGPMTQAAVIDCQRDNQLDIDGVVGPDTRRVLNLGA